MNKVLKLDKVLKYTGQTSGRSKIDKKMIKQNA